MEKDNCLHIATFVKTHGVEGELIIAFENNYLEEDIKMEVIFIDLDGGLVPFFITPKSLKPKTSTTAIVRLDDVKTNEKAAFFVSQKIYFPKEELSENENQNELIGFLVIDEKLGEIGIIEDILDYTNNPLIQIFCEGNEILLPYNQDLFVGIDTNEKVLVVNLPEGLLEINL